MALATLVAIAGCNFDQKGIAVTPATLNFPIAVSLSPPEAPGEASRYLFVVNSNFDLRFNDGTLMAFALDDVARVLADEGCSESSPCTVRDISTLLPPGGEVGIGSHSDGLAVNRDGTRLYLPARATRNLTFVDWRESGFVCDQEPSNGEVDRCGAAYRMGADGDVTSERELTLTGDPVAVVSGRLEDAGGAPDSGDFVLLALRDGRVALFIEEGGGTPVLAHIVGGFPDNIVSMTMQPGTGIAWLTSATSRFLSRVGIVVDRDPARSFLYDAGSLRLGGVDDGQDSRDIQFDPERPLERAFVLARRPESVITLDLTRMGLNAGDAGLGEIYRVGAGPSRLALARIAGRTYALASTFNARRLFVIDVEHGALVAVVGGFSGPFELVVDEARQLLYVADFSVSVIRIIDLAPLAELRPPHLVATLGEPSPVERFAN